MSRFREGRPTSQDINYINSRVQDKSTQMPSDIKYATYHNKDRDSINTAIFEQKVQYSMLHNENTTNFFYIL